MANNNTLNALNALADQVPGLNQRALKQVQSARDIALQRQIGAAAPGQPTAATAQQVATQRALQAGQDIVAQREQAAGRAEQIRQAALQQKAQQGEIGIQQQRMAAAERAQEKELLQLQKLRQEELKSRKTVLEEDLELQDRLERFGIDLDNKVQIATINQRKDLERVGLDVKRKLIDARLMFAQDARGAKFTSDRQLADWAASNAASRIDFNTRMQDMQKASELKILLAKQAQKHLEAALERGYIKEKNDLDHEARKKLAMYRHEMEKLQREEEAKVRNRAAMFQAAGALVGGVAGAVYGGPAGAAAGASAGGAVGSFAGSQLGG